MRLRRIALTMLVAPLLAQRLHPLPDLDKNMKTGPAVGQRIPSFQLPDQTGRLRNFDNLSGPKGLLLLFVRSADW